MNDESNMISNVFKDIMKKIGSSLISGQFTNALKISTPAYTHSNITYHDLIKCEFELIEETLCLMQENDMLGDPLELVKYLTAAKIGGFHIGVVNAGLRQPLNPILGETGVWKTERGGRLYLEQTSHHPPISHFQYLGPDSCPFEIFGYLEIQMNV